MQDGDLLYRLETAARRLGVTVRYEPCQGAGGMCVLRGERLIIVDEDQSPAEQALVIAEGLSRLDLEDVYLPPVVREAIEEQAGGSPPIEDERRDGRPGPTREDAGDQEGRGCD